MFGISKAYPGVTALDDVRLEVRAGEVHCLVGENGAGKSTLVKILGGAEPADSGRILVAGREVVLRSPIDALRAGIGVIYQDFKLVRHLTVAENVVLGRLPTRARRLMVHWPEVRARARGLLAALGEELDVDRRVADLAPAQQQMVEIARVLGHEARIVAMDEPSATLTDRELASLFRVVTTLAARGVGVLYISHRLEEVDELGDRVTVLRDGHRVETFRSADIDRTTLVRSMVGREIGEEIPGPAAAAGAPILRVEGLSRDPVVRDVSFEVRRGEVLAIAGLVGSGRTEVARLIFGADRKSGGRFLLDGAEIDPRTPRQAIDLGIGLLTEDRNHQGLILELSVRDNILLSGLASLRRALGIDWSRADEVSRHFIGSLSIRTQGPRQKVRHLSGGNRQKVVLARWLFAEAKVLLFDEPTKGIDVAVKREIHRLLRELADRGVGVVVISSELPEVLALGDRVAVMREGEVVGILPRGEATQEAVMRLATGTGLAREAAR
jgi:ribose transport system ATP-binding protein